METTSTPQKTFSIVLNKENLECMKRMLKVQKKYKGIKGKWVVMKISQIQDDQMFFNVYDPYWLESDSRYGKELGVFR